MNRSASDPGLAAAPRQPPEPQGLSWRNHMQSVLFVAEDSGDGGLARWWPFRFAHQQSGVLAFEPLGGGAEFFVNADWRQPFVAGPCRPVPVPADLAGLLPQNRKAGAQLYPFTLSYAPVPDPSQRHQDVPPRRSILLAAADSKLRAAWLANFSHKASAPELRHAQPPAKRVVTHSSSTSKLSGGAARTHSLKPVWKRMQVTDIHGLRRGGAKKGATPSGEPPSQAAQQRCCRTSTS